jgi:hypothetical protein
MIRESSVFFFSYCDRTIVELSSTIVELQFEA